MNNSIPLVSVIVPTYNVDRYIKKCLNSLMSQTLKELEFLCVDDGSTDASGRILDDYAAKDSRFKVVHQENQGAAAARNVGLNMATGEWVAFMDPDDFYPTDDTLQVMYENAIRHDVKICGGSMTIINRRGRVVKRKHIGDYEGYNFAKDGMMSFKDYQFDYGYTRFIYNRNFIEEHHLRFPLVRQFEDPPFFVRALSLAGSFYKLHRPTYTYLGGNGWEKTDWLANNYQKARDMLSGMAQVCEIAETNNLEKLRLRRLRFLYYGAGEIFQREEVLAGIKGDYARVLKQHTPLVSVVVPVYNDEKYIGECLDSILTQSYRNIEIICVNDGSTDNSPSILKQYAQKSDDFFSIKIVDRENGGLSAARNSGMNCATGKYIYFLDSDDMLNYDNAILEMVLLAEENRLDQLIFACRLFSDGKGGELARRVKAEEEYHRVYPPLKDTVLSGTELFTELERNGRFFATQQTRFYLLSSLTNYNLSYPEGLLHEDNYMAPLSLRFAERAMIVGQPFLARRIRAGSIVTKTGDMSKRFKGVWGIVQMLCQDKRLWDAPEDFKDMLRKYIHERIEDMYWLAQDTHDETLFAQKMFALSCIRNDGQAEALKTKRGLLRKLFSSWRKH
ncbi:MAG: glycosyltransferase [Bacteroidaceae bacterium]|nr:glycosyltransferase [Bacteroidaceae bacterium]